MYASLDTYNTSGPDVKHRVNIYLTYVESPLAVNLIRLYICVCVYRCGELKRRSGALTQTEICGIVPGCICVHFCPERFSVGLCRMMSEVYF